MTKLLPAIRQHRPPLPREWTMVVHLVRQTWTQLRMLRGRQHSGPSHTLCRGTVVELPKD